MDSRAGDGERRGEAAGPITVFLLDDHEIVRLGVRDLLETDPGIVVVGEAGTAASALLPDSRAALGTWRCLMCGCCGWGRGDGPLPGDPAARMPGVACLMLTSFSDEEALLDAVMVGAAGYMLKQIRGTDLIGAVRDARGRRVDAGPERGGQVDGQAAGRSSKGRSARGADRAGARILELIGEGLTNRQIGEQVFLAEKTVKNYVSGLYAKLGMERRAQAAALAARVFTDPPRAWLSGLVGDVGARAAHLRHLPIVTQCGDGAAVIITAALRVPETVS